MMKDTNSLIKLGERSTWTKVKALGALLGMTFIYIGALMSICSALKLDPMWPGITVIFSFSLLIAAIFGMKIKAKLPGDSNIDIEPQAAEDWRSYISGTQQAVVPAGASTEQVKVALSRNKELGMAKLLACADDKTGRLVGVVSELDVARGQKGTELSPNDDTVVHADRSPIEEAQRISKLPPNLQKDYLPLVDPEGKPLGTVSRIKLVSVLQKTSIAKAPTEIEF